MPLIELLEEPLTFGRMEATSKDGRTGACPATAAVPRASTIATVVQGRTSTSCERLPPEVQLVTAPPTGTAQPGGRPWPASDGATPTAGPGERTDRRRRDGPGRPDTSRRNR